VRVKAFAFLCFLSFAAFAQSARPGPSPTSEASRLGAEYFVQRAGAAWTYQLGKNPASGDRRRKAEGDSSERDKKGRVTIVSFLEWKAQVSISLGKIAGNASWRVKDGAWLERSGLRGEHEAMLLPAQMSRGTRWQDVASIERGGSKPSTYEVMALEAQVELPTGLTVDHCLAVLETPDDGSPSFTHYYAPNIGKVAVQGPEGWVYRLVTFTAGGKGHSE
jgi:hypothetical protein